MGGQGVTQAKENDYQNPKVVVIQKQPPPTAEEEELILGMVWWQLLCVVVGSVLVLLFMCICCCALLDSAQGQEVRGPNGERLGFMRAPGRHIVLVMDNRFGRQRGTNVPRAATTGVVVPAGTATAQAPATATGATSAVNPPHAPTVQPIYPKA